MDNHKSDVGLFRYSLIRDATDPDLTKMQRGVIVREIAAQLHRYPNGSDVTVSRATVDRWIRAYKSKGFEALMPKPSARSPRISPEILQLAIALKTEEPARTAAQVARLIIAQKGYCPSVRTLQRHFRDADLHQSGTRVVFGRFEAKAPNDRWIGDGLHGPIIAGSKTVLFAFIDDHSRTLCGYQWFFTKGEATLVMCKALRRGLSSCGVPKSIYVDNGSAFSSKHFDRACAKLGIRLIHSRPGKPEGRGKIERFFRTVRDQFLVEVPHSTVNNIEELNKRFDAWVEQQYHRNTHSETDATPLERFNAGGSYPCPAPDVLREAFLWSNTRTVTKTATISLQNNSYELDPALVGRKVEVIFDPFDLTKIKISYNGKSFGFASPHQIKSHVHPAVLDLIPQSIQPSGIDYLAMLVNDFEQTQRAPGSQTSFASLIETNNANQIPGQLQIPGADK